MTTQFKQEVRSILGITTNGGLPQIQGVHPKFLTCDVLRCNDIWITGSVKTFLTIMKGTATAPSLRFVDDISTGVYWAGAGKVGVTGSGASVFTASAAGLSLSVPITTVIGDLVLNPAGSNIDCSGKNLINVGGFSPNPNRYDVIGTQVTTINATPTVILTIPLSAAGYGLSIDVVYVTGTSVATYTVLAQAKNTGTASLALLTSSLREDVPLTGANAVVSASGTDIIVTATGIAATTIKWIGVATVTRCLF